MLCKELPFNIYLIYIYIMCNINIIYVFLFMLHKISISKCQMCLYKMARSFIVHIIFTSPDFILYYQTPKHDHISISVR